MFPRLLILLCLLSLFSAASSPRSVAQQSDCPILILLPSDNVAYGDAMELAQTLRKNGLVVKCVALSKEDRMFEGQVGAANYRTDLGDFDALFLPKLENFNSLKIMEQKETAGGYQYSFRGKPHSLTEHWEGTRPSYFVKHANQLLHSPNKPLAAKLESLRSTPDANICPVSPHVIGYPAGGPSGDNDWYANADRTIWATFWGWDFVRGPDKPDPKTGYVPGQKVLWYKPSDFLLPVIGRRMDGAASPLVYDISRDPRPRGAIQPSRIYFPTDGCWEVDAKAGNSGLRFVVLVKSRPL